MQAMLPELLGIGKRARGDLIQTNTLGTSTMDVVIQDNTFQNAHTSSLGGGIAITGGSANSNINLTYDVSPTSPGLQTFKEAVVSAIFADIGNGQGTITGNISDNVIGVPSSAGSGSIEGGGIAVGAATADNPGDPGGRTNMTHTVTIHNNTIREITGFAGIRIRANKSADLHATVTNNSVTAVNGAFSTAALSMIVGGGAVGDDAVMCVDLRNNILDGSGIPASAVPLGAVSFDQISAFAHYNLPQYAGGANGASANIETYLTGRGNVLSITPGFPLVEAGFTLGVTGTGTTCP